MKKTRKKLRVDELEIYAPGQRKYIESWAKKIADDFDQDALGVFHVSSRGSHNFVIDGQHRLGGLRLLEKGDLFVECLVYHDLTKAKEAELFLKLNASKFVKAIDKFTVRITAEDEVAVSIRDICNSYGIVLADGSCRPNYTSAVGALERVYTGKIVKSKEPVEGPLLLKTTLGCIRDSWNGDPNSFNGNVISGLGAFLAVYWSQIETDRLARVMQKYPGGASGLIRSARALRDIRRIPILPAFVNIFIDMWNTGLRSNHLPDWR